MNFVLRLKQNDVKKWNEVVVSEFCPHLNFFCLTECDMKCEEVMREWGNGVCEFKSKFIGATIYNLLYSINKNAQHF